MKSLLRSLRVYWLGFGKHLLWMLLSYAGVVAAAWFFVLKPQTLELAENRKSAQIMEHNYRLLVSAPELPDDIGGALKSAQALLDEMYWLSRDPEPNQLLFVWLDELAVANNLVITDLTPSSQDTAKTGKADPYLTWKVNLVGTYGDLARFIHALEENLRYLRVTGLVIKGGTKEGASSFFLTVVGLRK